MLNIEIDDKAIESKFLEEMKKRLDVIERRHTFWSMKELCKQTNLSEPTIKEKFFYDERFPKHKVGTKWIFPAAECEKFLLMWLSEQPRN